MTNSAENGRLARIETKLDTALEEIKAVCSVVHNSDTGIVAHEQRIRVVEGRTRAIVAISTAILVAVLGVAIKIMAGG